MTHEARYRFLPWARRGLQPASPDSLSGRVNVKDSLPVTLAVGAEGADGSDLGSHSATVDLRLYGPGDVVGIDRRQIIRTVPRDGTRDFEPNYFASVEFARPDLAWLFSPARAASTSTVHPIDKNHPWQSGRNLRPWMTLVVVPESAATLEAGGSGGEALARLTVDASELPSPDETWAWAHVQVVGGEEESDVTDPEWVASQLTERSSLATCRLVCPRALEAERSYVACVVPTFDAGREAGLGREPPTGSVITAWGPSDGLVTLPVYHSWRFATGQSGDFESLAERLESGPVPRNVGYCDVDVREPIRGRDTLAATGDDPETVTLAGALRSPAEPPTVRSYPENKRATLRDLLTPSDDEDGVPVVSPPVYGRWQAGASLPETEDDAPPWLHQLNVDPENRAVAGLGARIVRENQEALMDQAWDQVGQLREANQALDRSVLGTMASQRLHERLEAVSAFDLKRLSHSFHERVTVSPGSIRSLPGETLPSQTVGEFLKRGPAPTSVLSPTFTRMLRRGSGPGRLVDAVGTTPGSFVESIETGDLTLSGRSGVGGGRPLPTDVADAIEVVIRERGQLADEREARHAERVAEAELLQHEISEVRTDLLARAEALESVVVVDPLPDREVRGRWSNAGNRIRTDRRISVLRDHGRTTLADFEVEDEDDVRELSSVLTDMTFADLETNFGDGNRRVLLDPTRLRRDLDGYRSTLEVRVSEVGEPMTLGEYGAAMNDIDAVVEGGIQEIVTAIRERPESFDDRIEIQKQVAKLDEIAPLLASLAETLAESEPPVDRAAAYYRQVWARHFEPTQRARVVSLSSAAAANAEQTVQTSLLQALDPETTVRERLQTRLTGVTLSDELPDVIAPHPTIDTPMYEPLVETALRYFLPGVGDIPNNSLTLLETNAQFIESYLVGLNHEFASELRWREFPTDMRGTYFDRFWDTTVRTATEGESTPPADIPPIHEWRGSRGNDLGDHLQTVVDDEGGSEEMLVVVVRGDLLKRYPNTHVYAERGRWQEPTEDDLLFTETTDEDGNTVVRESATDESGNPVIRAPIPRMKTEGDNHIPNPAYEARYPLFSGTIAPDITFLGLPLTAEEARGSADYADGDAGWFIVLEEPTGESRFGLDAPTDAGGEDPNGTDETLKTWDELAWDHVVTEEDHLSLAKTLKSPEHLPLTESARATFGRNSAHVAHITWQRPVRVAVHADDMLPTETEERQ